MVLKYKGFACITFLLLLSGCSGSSSKKSKKMSRSLSKGNGSFFGSISEKEIRNDVREYHALEQQSDQVDSSKQSGVVIKKMSRKQKISYAQERARQQEAKLIDIPFLLEAEPLVDFFQDQTLDASENVELGYQTDLSMQEVVSFYQKGMERNGWKELLFIFGYESLVCFVKPNRYCSISVRPHAKRAQRKDDCTRLIIFLGKTADSLF